MPLEHWPPSSCRKKLASFSFALAVPSECPPSGSLPGQRFLVIQVIAQMTPPLRSPSDCVNQSSCPLFSPFPFFYSLAPGALSRPNQTPRADCDRGCGSGPGQGAGLPGPRKGQLFDAGYHVLEYLVQSYCLMKGWKDLGPKACNELREATSQSPAPQEDEPMAGLYIS